MVDYRDYIQRMKKSGIAALFLILFAGVLFSRNKVFAAEKVVDFTATITAQRSGILHVEEKISYDFSDSAKHGIYRTIPLVSKVGNLYRIIRIHIDSVKRDGTDEVYTSSQTEQALQVRIGEAGRIIRGAHQYVLSYDVQNAIGSNYTDHDEIYWNVTGNNWNVPIESAAVTLRTDFGIVPGNTVCFTGITGATEHNCSVWQAAGDKRIVVTMPLAAQNGLTIVSSFPVNTFPKSVLQNSLTGSFSAKAALIIVCSVYALFNLVFAPFLFVWYRKNKHKQRFGPPGVNFDFPEDGNGKRLPPAEAGTIDNMKLDRDDITATIFDLAIRKYIRIEEAGNEGGFLGVGKKPEYRLVKRKNFSDLSEFERRAMSTVFHQADSVLVNKITIDYLAYDDLRRANFISLVKKKLYIKDPTVQMNILLAFGILFTVTLNIFLGPLLILLSRKLNGRTQLGDEVDWKIDGLKLFLRGREKNYRWQSEKAYTVESMIPYAMALGYIASYMEQLKLLKPDYQPSWYSGRTPFYLMYPGFTTSFSSNIVTMAPSSSSGFSGGSSGGGGGGGGGGSW